MKKAIILTVVSLLVLGFSVIHANAKVLVLSGSTTVQKRVLEPAKTSIESNTGVEIEVRGIGSGKGFKELRDGKVKASISSSSLSLLLEKAGLSQDGTYKEHIITQDVIVPIVNPSNPVSELTWKQLSDINTGKITNWKELGGPDRKIIVVTSHKASATRAVFQELVMKKADYVKGAREVRSTRQEVELVGKLKGGIGAVSEGFVRLNPGKVKIIKSDKISRPLSIITKGEPSSEVKKIIVYLSTPDAQKLFK